MEGDSRNSWICLYRKITTSMKFSIGCVGPSPIDPRSVLPHSEDATQVDVIAEMGDSC